jgi:hypothetical protein
MIQKKNIWNFRNIVVTSGRFRPGDLCNIIVSLVEDIGWHWSCWVFPNGTSRWTTLAFFKDKILEFFHEYDEFFLMNKWLSLSYSLKIFNFFWAPYQHLAIQWSFIKYLFRLNYLIFLLVSWINYDLSFEFW